MKGSNHHWAGVRERGSLLGMQILLGAYQLGGKTLFGIFLFPVVLFYTLLHPVAQRASRQYREKMHAYNPDFPPLRPWHSFKHLWSFATTLLDKLAVWMGNITRADVVLHNGGIIDELLARGQGAVILISHLGNFEICQALSESRPGLQLTVLHHTKHAEKFNLFLNSHSRETTVNFMQVTELGFFQAISMSERLSAGHFYAISADRVAIGNSGRVRRKPFLGQPAAFPTGPFILTLALQAPVLSIQCIRQGKDQRYHIYFEVLSEGGPVPRRLRDARLDQLIDAYVANLEKYCLKAPWQWYNFYPFWQEESTVP